MKNHDNQDQDIEEILSNSQDLPIPRKMKRLLKSGNGKSDLAVQIKAQIQMFKDEHGRDELNKGISYRDLSYRCINNQHSQCSGHFIMGGKKCSCRCHEVKS